jgi:uronate dehydrogenase
VGRALRQVLTDQVAGIRIIDLAEPSDLARNENWYRADICDLAALMAAVEGVDAIVHLAGYPNERAIEDILRVNVLGTHNIYEAARRVGIARVVFGSSNHVTGFYPRTTPVGANDPMRPDSLYGLSKCWGELEAGLYFEKAGIRSLLIRIGNASKQPADSRSLVTWISPRDLAQLVLIGLEHPNVDCTTVYGVSMVDGAWWDNATAAALGYQPQDRATDFATPEAFDNKPSEMAHVADYFQGGRFCVRDHDGIERRRWAGNRNTTD